jgi:hypothetical protein
MGAVVMAAAVAFLSREPVLLFMQFILGAGLFALGVVKLRERGPVRDGEK